MRFAKHEKNIFGKDYMRPIISVIMSVYNTPIQYLIDSIESILNQTFTDFEFLIVDDASTDESIHRLLETYNDPRMYIIHNEINRGLTYNLNVLFKLAKGQYIARMDADDISMPDRLEKQYSYMEKYKQVQILGSFVQANRGIHMFGGNMDYAMRKAKMLFYNAGICHPSAMIRKSFLDNHRIEYNTSIRKAQDYSLWISCLEWTNLVVFPEALLYYREHDGQISKLMREGVGGQKEFSRVIREKQLNSLGVSFTQENLENFMKLGEGDYNFSIKSFIEIYNRILIVNKNRKLYNQFKLKNELKIYWLKMLIAHKGIGMLKELKLNLSIISPWFICDLFYRLMLRTKFFNRFIVAFRMRFPEFEENIS